MTQSGRSPYDFLTCDFSVKSIALITVGTGEEEYEILVSRCRCAADGASLYRRFIFVFVLQFRWNPLRDPSNCCRGIVLRLLCVRAAFCFSPKIKGQADAHSIISRRSHCRAIVPCFLVNLVWRRIRVSMGVFSGGSYDDGVIGRSCNSIRSNR